MQFGVLSNDRRMKRHLPALVIPALMTMGLVAGLIREVFLAHLFGTSHEIEVFRVAFGLPSILSESLGISFVSVLVPILLADREASRLQRPIWTTSLLAGLVFLVGVLTMPLQARILAPGIVGEQRTALISAGMLCWGMFLLSILSLPLRAFMSVNGRLWPGASAAFWRSGGFVLALGALVFAGEELVAGTAAWAALLAGMSVLAIHVLALGVDGRRQVGSVLKAGPPSTGTARLLTALALVLGMQLILSGGRLLDRMVASTMAAGSLAAIEYSYAFLLAVAAIVGTSANIFLAPRIGRAFKETGRLPARYWKAVAAVAAAGALAGLMLAALAVPVVRLVLEHGTFGPDDTALTVRVLRLHALALGPLILSLVLTQVLILSGRQRWMVPIAGIKLAVKAVGLWLLLQAGMGLEGIALSLGVAEVGMAITLALILRRHVQGSPQ